MTNLQLFRRSLANHPGLQIGFAWPLLLAAAMLLGKTEPPPLSFWLVVYPAVAALPWAPILYTSWTMRKQYIEKECTK